MLLFVAVGCARYEFDVVQPPELAAHVGSKSDTITNLDPLVYKWRAVDNRLVVQVFNPTGDTIQLLGEQSTVVSPDGANHPVRGQTIAPQSYAKLILPPLQPRVYDPWYDYGGGGSMMIHDHHDHDPRYMMVLYDDDWIYWNWKGSTQARLILAYQHGERSFRHEFTIQRRKM